MDRYNDINQILKLSPKRFYADICLNDPVPHKIIFVVDYVGVVKFNISMIYVLDIINYEEHHKILTSKYGNLSSLSNLKFKDFNLEIQLKMIESLNSAVLDSNFDFIKIEFTNEFIESNNYLKMKLKGLL